MKTVISLQTTWQRRDSDGGWEHYQAFEAGGDFHTDGACLEFRELAPGATVLLNGIELGSASGYSPDRFDARGAIHPGRNEVVVRGAPDDPATPVCREARVISYDKVSISGIEIDPEVIDQIANVWITVAVANHTEEEQPVLASIVVAQGENREKVEIGERIPPSGGEIDAVIRIVDPAMWEPGESGEPQRFDCMVGLQIKGEIMDVAEEKFEVGLSP